MSNDTNIQSSQSLPSSEHKQLGVFIGRWHTTGEVGATSSSPAVKLDSIDVYEWYAGEFFVVHDADSKMGDDVVKSLEIIGYDHSRNFIWHLFLTAPEVLVKKRYGMMAKRGHVVQT